MLGKYIWAFIMQWCPHHLTDCLVLRWMGLNLSLLADSAAIWIPASLDILIQKAECSRLLQHCPLQERCQCYLPLQQLHRNTSVTIQWHYILHPFSLVNQIVKIGRGGIIAISPFLCSLSQIDCNDFINNIALVWYLFLP